MTENYDGFGGSGIFFAFLIFALFAFGGNGGGWGWGGRGGALGGAGAVIADNGINSQLDNIQAQNFYNSLNNGIAGIQSALCQWGCKNYNIYDLYYTLNMVRSDYYKEGQAPQYYADLAFDFLEDKDAPEGKAKRYYLAMHCAE